MATTGSGLMMNKPQPATRNQEATVYVGNLDEKVTEPLLWEMMVQAGPVVHVHIPRDRVTQQHQGYGFCEFQTEDDAEYAVKIMNGVRLYSKPIRINKSSTDKRTLDVGANLFIGNLAPDADEKLLFDTFILFGTLIQTPKVARDEATGVSKGFGFVSYDSFEAADAAIESMNGQYLCNRPVTVNYAFKKDGKGERHGSAPERLLATQTRKASQASGLTSTMAPSQFALQMQMQQQQQMSNMNSYPSHVPAAMYYSNAPLPGMMPGQMVPGYQQPMMQGYHPSMMPGQMMPGYQPPMMMPQQMMPGYQQPMMPGHQQPSMYPIQQQQQPPPQ